MCLAAEDWSNQFIFELSQLLRYGWLGLIQCARSGRHAQSTANEFGKALHLLQVHFGDP
jgi:hypothetical protein